MIVLLAIGLAFAAVLCLALLDLLVKRPVVVTWLILALVVLGVLIEEGTSVKVAGFQVSPADVGFSLVAGAAVLRYLGVGRTSSPQKALVALGTMSLISVLLGVASGPVDSVLNEFRNYLGILGAALYFSTVELNSATREAMSRAWLGAGVALGAVVVLRWATRFGGFDLGILESSLSSPLRVVDGPATLTIASIALILLLPKIHEHSLKRSRQQQSGVVLLLIAILLNRRTLWLGLAIVLVVLLVRDRRVGGQVATIAAAGIVLFAFAVPLLGGRDENVSVAEGVTDTENLAWRFDGWAGLLDSGPSRLDEYLIGLPFGSGYERWVDGIKRVSTPHNFYLQTYLRAGVIGLIVLLLTLFLTVMALLPRTTEDNSLPFARDHLLLLVILLGVWLLAWLPLAEQGIILGLAIAAASERGHRSRFVAEELVAASPANPERSGGFSGDRATPLDQDHLE